VPKDYGEQHIRDMITDCNVTGLDIAKVSHRDANMCSFKVSVYRDDEAKLMLPDSWPEFIECRRFIAPRRRTNDASTKFPNGVPIQPGMPIDNFDVIDAWGDSDIAEES